MHCLRVTILTFSLLVPAARTATELAGIAHVAFRVADFDKSRRFYLTLGFEESFAYSDPGKAPVSYIKINNHQFVELYGRENDSQPIGLMHVCYESDDIQALHDEYLKRGVDAPPPRKFRAGNLLFLIRDTENQVVEFTEYLPGSMHFEDRGKHLGERRLTERLAAVTVPVHDAAAELAFLRKLGFEPSAGSLRLALPGSSGQTLGLEADNTHARITLSISDLPAAAAELRRRSFAPEVSGNLISVSDPDGNLVQFEKSAAPSLKAPKE